MSKIIEDMRREEAEKTLIEVIQTVMRKLKYTAQQAMDLIGIPESEQPKYLAKL